MNYSKSNEMQAQQSLTRHTIDNILRSQDNHVLFAENPSVSSSSQNVAHEQPMEAECVEASVYEMVQPRKNARRRRTMYTKNQLNALERVFRCAPYPDAPARNYLASDLQITEERIQVWFQNRRAKARKDTPGAADEMNRMAMLPPMFGPQFGAAAGMQQLMSMQQMYSAYSAGPFMPQTMLPQVIMPEPMMLWRQ